MKSLRVMKGANFFITDGPSIIDVEHSLFGQQSDGETRKMVHFSAKNTDPSKEHTLKYVALVPDNKFSMVVIAVFRLNPNDPKCSDWILWGLDGGRKIVMNYSTQDRNGSGKHVTTFPEHGI